MKEFYGYGRSRSSSGKGEVTTRHFNDYTNCIHANVGGTAWGTMEVLVAEFDMSETKYIGRMSSSQNSRVVDSNGISYAITNGEKDGMPKILERDTPMKGNYKEPRICTMVGRDPNNPGSRARSDYYEQMLELGDNVSNTLTSVQKDNLVAEPLRIRQATKQGYVEVEQGGVFDATYPDSTTRRGRVQEGGSIAPTLMASGDAPCRYEGVKEPSYRIRKLTPRECFRLMGVDETDIDKIQESGVSHTQQYKMAGNSIVVDCLYHIFRKLFTEQQSEGKQLTLF